MLRLNYITNSIVLVPYAVNTKAIPTILVSYSVEEYTNIQSKNDFAQKCYPHRSLRHTEYVIRNTAYGIRNTVLGIFTECNWSTARVTAIEEERCIKHRKVDEDVDLQ